MYLTTFRFYLCFEICTPMSLMSNLKFSIFSVHAKCSIGQIRTLERERQISITTSHSDVIYLTTFCFYHCFEICTPMSHSSQTLSRFSFTRNHNQLLNFLLSQSPHMPPGLISGVVFFSHLKKSLDFCNSKI